MTIENQTFVTFEDVFPIEHRGFSNVILVNSGVGHDLRNFQCLFLLVFIWAISEVTLPFGHHSDPLCLYQYGWWYLCSRRRSISSMCHHWWDLCDNVWCRPGGLCQSPARGKACMIYMIYPLKHLYVLRLESDWTHRRLWTFLNSHSPRLMFWRPCYTRFFSPAKICQVFIWGGGFKHILFSPPWGRWTHFWRAHIFQMRLGTNHQPSVISFIQAVARWWSSRLVSVGWSTAFGVAPRLAR